MGEGLPPPGAPRTTDATRALLARRRALLGPRAEYTVVNRQLPGLHEQVNAYQERIFLFAHHCSPFVMRIKGNSSLFNMGFELE